MPDHTMALLFLSLKYHRLHPEYIYNRISKMGKNYRLRILLVVVDIENHNEPLKELTKTGVVNGLTLILCWSAKEAGHYISLFAILKATPPTSIMAPQKEDYAVQMIDCISAIRGVNKNDATSLITSFGSLKSAVLDQGKSLSSISGWGDLKIRRYKSAISDPFVVRNQNFVRTPKKRKTNNSLSSTGHEQDTGNLTPTRKTGDEIIDFSNSRKEYNQKSQSISS
ncbi:restriction endonuclease type II-like protein [Dipodascopsis uninucleata]